MKHLIVGLGNIGEKYSGTRHNIGFDVLDSMAEKFSASFADKRYGSVCEIHFKNCIFLLLKPSTYVNLSGNAVRYWINKAKIPLENMLVIVDDIALPIGSIRMRAKGSDGGHNGLAHINQVLGTDEYARIRIGIGNGFSKGAQVNFVLGKWNREEKELLKNRISLVIQMIESFGTAGVELTMSAYNKAGKTLPDKNTGTASPD